LQYFRSVDYSLKSSDFVRIGY